jgi:hypothetical protein
VCYGTNIPGFTGYTITENGKVFKGSRLLHALQSPGRAARVKLKNCDGKFIRVAIAKLLAITFIDNPHNYTKIIFKDRNKNNCTVNNIQWVSVGEWCRFVNHHAASDALLGAPRPRRQPDPIDPGRVPVQNFPGYYITANGVVYKENRIIKPVVKKGKSLKVRIRKENKYLFFGLAKLVAAHFIPNPKCHTKIIFKDRNNHHCSADNIAWVDGETFIYYSGIYTGRKKKLLPREEAMQACRDIYLRRYYATLDESWLHECWHELEKKITLANWHHYRAECFLYFFDRARRCSILGNPLGLILLYVKGVRANFYKEISPDMSIPIVVKTDECLRRIINRERD